MILANICAILALFFPAVLCCSSPQTIHAVAQGTLVSSGLHTLFVAKFALFIACFLSIVLCFGHILRYVFKMPTIAGQIIGGIIVGPSCINIASIPLFTDPLLLVDQVSGVVYSFVSSDFFIFFLLLLSAAFTVSYLLWLAGYETDINDIAALGMTPVTAGVLGALLPIVIIAGVLWYWFAESWDSVASLSMGVVFAATSVSIPVAMLFSLNKMHLRSSKATLGAAIIDDIFAVILLSLFFLYVPLLRGDVFAVGQVEHSAVYSLGYMAAGLILLWITGYVIIPRFLRFLVQKKLYELIAPFSNVFMFASFAFLELFAGLAGITGAYFAGLFHRIGDVRHTAEKTLAPFVNAILLPLFLGSIGLQVNVSVLTIRDWGLVILILMLSVVSKMVGCWIATALSNATMSEGSQPRWSLLETYLFGSSMIARGEVGLVVATIVYGAGLIESHHYVIAVVTIVLTTITASVLLSIGFSYSEQYKNLLCAEQGEKTLVLGPFPSIGTMQMFNIIVGQLKKQGLDQSFVAMSEGRKVLTLEDKNVRIILRPGKDITFKGDPSHIKEIVQFVKASVARDIENM